MSNKIVDFVHLHCHSEFSTLDGLPKVEDYIIKSVELGFPALALTEHGNLRSMVQLIQKCNSNFMYGGVKYDFEPIKPIIGCEFYLSPNDYKIKGLPDNIKNKIKEKSESTKQLKELTKKYELKYAIKKRWHMLMFAKNTIGLNNILTMNYLSWKYGFYYRPRIDMNLVKKYSEGIIATTSCIGGMIPDLILNDKKDDAYLKMKEMKKIFKDDFYVEVQPHNIDEQKTVNKVIVDMANDLKVKVIATNDCHYLNKGDDSAHNMLLDINSRASKSTPTGDRWRFGDTEFYMKSKDEMAASFLSNHSFFSKKEINNFLENTVEISDKVDLKIVLSKKKGILPNVTVPDGYENENKYLIKLAKDGWKWRNINLRAKEYANHFNLEYSEARKIYKDRMILELKRIFKMKYTKVFLIIQDMINWARRNDIYVGAGRGSSAASLICYLTGITSIDPLRYDLMFDRFLHEKRIDYPDVDMDFQDDRRKEIFGYLFKKYGANYTAMIGTIGRMKGKQAIQDVSRVLGIPSYEVNAVTKHLIIRGGGDARSSQTVEDSFNEFEVSKQFNKKYPEVLPYVKKLEAKARQVGIHAAGIVLSPFVLYKNIPIEFRKSPGFEKPVPVTAIDARDIENYGLIKFDLLGLSELTIFKYALAEIKKRYGKEIDLEAINLEDKNVLNNFTKGNFAGIFQFDSIGMKKTCEKMRFDSFDDIIVLNALYRPGCIMEGTKITVEMDNHNRRTFYEIGELYNKWINAPLCTKNVKRNFNIVSYDENKNIHINNKIVDIVKSGKKECFEIILQSYGEGKGIIRNKWIGKSGFSKKHKILTLDAGWKNVKDLQYGDYVLYRFQNTVAKGRINTANKKRDNKFVRKTPYKSIALFYYKSKCAICGYDKKNISLDCHHMDNNQQNNDYKNLIILCPNCHREVQNNLYDFDFLEKKRKESRLPNSYKNKFRWSKVVEIKSLGVHETYDIEMTSPYNNFVAGGLVVHNSMRSGMAKHYIDRKMGREKVTKRYPLYDEITEKTYGIVVYQEQLMQVFMKVAGYQPSKADIVRVKVAKSSGVESIWREKEDFMNGAKKNNVPEKIANQLFKDMSFFGSYTFNKAHAAAYSVNSYIGMWLKTYYPTEFFYAMLRKENKNERIREFIIEAKLIGISIKMPDINLSNEQFSIISEKNISVGLTDVKGVGLKAAKIISDNKPYTSLYNFINKVDRRIVNKRVINSLIVVGAFKNIYSHTAALLKEVSIQRIKRDGSELKITKKTWEWMIEEKTEFNSELFYKTVRKETIPFTIDEEQRLMAKVSPLPPDKHEIEYYKYLDKYVDKCYKITDINKINYDEKKFILRGIIVDIKYNQIGDFFKELPPDETKERIGWGKRYVSINIDDGTGIKRMKVDIDTFSTFRYIIDKGIGTPVMVAVRSFSKFEALFVDNMIDLNELSSIIDLKSITIKESFKKLNKFQRYFIQHPIKKYKECRTKVDKIIDKKNGIFETVCLISKVKHHWTNKDDKEMMFIDLEDETGNMDVVIWNDVLMKNRKKLQQGNIVKVNLIKKGKSIFIKEKSEIILLEQRLKYL